MHELGSYAGAAGQNCPPGRSVAYEAATAVLPRLLGRRILTPKAAFLRAMTSR